MGALFSLVKTLGSKEITKTYFSFYRNFSWDWGIYRAESLNTQYVVNLVDILVKEE